MCGVLAVTFEHYEEAQTFLEQAVNTDPSSVVAWTLLGEPGVRQRHKRDTVNQHLGSVCLPVTCPAGLLHQTQDQSRLAQRAFLEATKQLRAEEAKENEKNKEQDTSACPSPAGNKGRAGESGLFPSLGQTNVLLTAPRAR